jgi:hypothetical protein
MAANPNVVPQLELASEKETTQKMEPETLTLKRRVRNLLIDIFEGHEDFLGRTPD